MADLKQKNKIKAEAGIQLSAENVSRALELDASGNVKSSTVTSTELSQLSGVTGPVQQQISDAQSTIDTHISVLVDAHDASAISVAAISGVTGDDVQEVLESLKSQIDAVDVVQKVNDLITLSGVAANSTDLGTFTGTIIPDNSDIKEALQSLETSIETLPDPMEYKGSWNATTNTPALTDGTGNNGDVYRVSVAGTQFTPSIQFKVGDRVVYDGSTGKYEKWDTTDEVFSVFSRVGDIVAESGDYDASQITVTPVGGIAATDVQAAITELDSEKLNAADFDAEFDASLATKTTSDLTEGTNLYHTDERAQDAVGSILSNTDTINLSYTDATPIIYADVKTQMSITSDASGIKLTGDSASPGNVKYYGTNASGTKGYYDIPAVGSEGDIQETLYGAANNQTTPTNVTGFAFSNAVVRSFKALVSVDIDATTDLFEAFELLGVQKSTGWDLIVSSTGDDSGIVFSIDSSGQVQYTSTNITGFVTNRLKFRAITTSL